jgi:hypothetical protein
MKESNEETLDRTTRLLASLQAPQEARQEPVVPARWFAGLQPRRFPRKLSGSLLHLVDLLPDRTRHDGYPIAPTMISTPSKLFGPER